MFDRRSFLTSLLSAAAGAFVVGSALVSRRASAEECPADETATKYGGPPTTKYGGPTTKYGGPAKKKKKDQAKKYGGPPGPTVKYGGPPTTKYGGPPKK